MLIRLFTSKCAFYVGDSTAKVVNSEQITTTSAIRAVEYSVGDSTAKVVNSEQITTRKCLIYILVSLVILPQR